LNDPDSRAQLAENAFEKVQGLYDWKRIAAEFEVLYRQVAAR
jgi:glycosyltransferase involved in cell wall biosynthesis